MVFLSSTVDLISCREQLCDQALNKMPYFACHIKPGRKINRTGGQIQNEEKAKGATKLIIHNKEMTFELLI